MSFLYVMVDNGEGGTSYEVTGFRAGNCWMWVLLQFKPWHHVTPVTWWNWLPSAPVPKARDQRKHAKSW